MRERLEAALADRYLIQRELGRGGMATVWLARDTRHDRSVAIKVLHPELAGAIGVDRFVREVRLTARLQHSSIVPVLDSGVLPATDELALPWYAMAYVEGESIRTRLARELQLPVDEALRITRDVAGALHAAHKQGVVHRDIKPENVLLADGRVYVVDFGIAKALLETGDERLTRTGLTVGTPSYMSPEQATAGVVDARSDQYSLATMLYEMLAGEPPFTGPNTQTIIARRLTESARPIRPARPGVPAPVETAVLKALERVPADRFADVAAFAAALEEAEAAVDASRSGNGARTRWALGTAAVVGALALGAWLYFPRSTGRQVDPDLVALYQRGVAGYDRRTPGGAVEAIAAFSTAIRRDSAFAPAWAGLAKTYVRAFQRGFVFPGVARDSVLRLAVAAVDQALLLDSDNAETWVAQAELTRNVDPTDLRPALRAARKAIQLDSANGEAWHYLAISLADSGDLEGALTAWRESVRRSPSYTQGLAFLALGHYWRRAYDSAAVWADSVVYVDPRYALGRTTAGLIAVERGDFARAASAFDAARRLTTDVELVTALAGLALADARAGRRSEARATLRQADSLGRMYAPTPPHTAVFVSQAYAALGDADNAIAWLRRYSTQRDLHFQLHLRCDPPFDPIAANRRFRALLVGGARAGKC